MRQKTRERIVAEAYSWLHTPFHLNAAVKGLGGGVDCGRFPWLVYSVCGISVPELPSHWPRDFMNHKMAEREPYLTLIRLTLLEIESPEMGDLVLFQQGNCYSHAGIIVKWPEVIHARGFGSHPQVEISSVNEWPLKDHALKFFRGIELI